VERSATVFFIEDYQIDGEPFAHSGGALNGATMSNAANQPKPQTRRKVCILKVELPHLPAGFSRGDVQSKKVSTQTKADEIKRRHYRVGFAIMVTKDFYHFDKSR
jgi:hypothetical protein